LCLVFEVANIIGVVPACIVTGGTRHVNKKHRHNLNTNMHAGTTPIILATSKTRHTVLPEDGPIGLKHAGVNDEVL